MAVGTYLRSVRNSLKRTWTSKTALQRKSKSKFNRLFLELLENRIAPATVIWNNPAGGDWDTAGNWTGGTGPGGLPGPSDDVVINALNAGASITHALSNTDSVNSITAGA